MDPSAFFLPIRTKVRHRIGYRVSALTETVARKSGYIRDVGELALYVHVPFCPKKCPYCDFASYALGEAEHERFVRACQAEIRSSRNAGSAACTVFFGGGTPTYLSTEHIETLFRAITDTFRLAPDAEVSCEANPGTADAARFRALRHMGFNRISIGAQSFDEAELRVLGRIHSAEEIYSAVEAARSAGFENLNLDLIYGLPRQTLDGWLCTVRRALSLEPEHLSLYCLTIEPGTQFERLRAQGLLELPEEELQLTMQEEAETLCQHAGLVRYEISNYARPGMECRHNLIYWRNQEYVGFGPAAVSYVHGIRTKNLRSPSQYAEAMEKGRSTVEEHEQLDDDLWLAETSMLGLRTMEGVRFSRLEERVPDARARLAPKLKALQKKGWLEDDGTRFCATREGLRFHDSLAMSLLP